MSNNFYQKFSEISAARSYFKSLCIADLLKQQSKKNPDAIAILTPGRAPLTYSRLWSHIQDVIAKLNSFGIGRNDRVAVALPNGAEMATAFLSIAATATCAPLNIAYRTNEFEFYLKDLNAKALIVQSNIETHAIAAAKSLSIPLIKLLPVLESEAGIFVLNGCESASRVTNYPADDDIALVLHTSGTTSRPKIVPLSYRHLCTSANNICTTLQLVEGDRSLNVMPLFHIHGLIGVLLSSLTAGASVVCTPGFLAPSFFNWFSEFHPTWYSAVPTMHQAILARSEVGREIIAKYPIRLIRSSSSSLPPQVMADLEKVFNAPVIESYGMTEAAHQMASNPLPPLLRKPGSVGVAAGPELAIMDESGNLLQTEEVGEIVIRGANVTSGYENNPTANANAFTNGWFRTGDIGYLDSDNYLFIQGRIKEIINRGGEKISPREVDEVILNHPAIAQVVTFAIPHPQLGEDVAVAVVLHQNLSVTAREVQEFAALQLADFKVPAKVVFLDEIPKGPTGKLQRIGLAERLGIIVSLTTETKTVFSSPITPVEKQLADIWAEVLGVEQIGIDNNFFHLGGDSILAGLILNRIRKVLQVELSFLALFETPTIAGLAKNFPIQKESDSESIQSISVEIPIRAVFESPTVAQLDKTITQLRTTEHGLTLPPIQPIRGDTELLPLSWAQQRLWFLNQLEGSSATYNMPFSLRITGNLDLKTLQQALSEIIRRHSVLRTSFPTVNGTPRQVIHPEATMNINVVDLQQLSVTERETVLHQQAQLEAITPFNLENAPLIRCSLLELSATEYVLLLTMHHIVSDGWSMGVLIRELSALYPAFCAGVPSELPELPIQYADFAVWQRQCLSGEVLETQLNYWVSQLQGVPLLLQLPTDRPRARVQTHQGRTQSFSLNRDLTQKLQSLSRASGTTLFMTLLAAFATLLYRYSGESDIVIGSPIANRNRSEIELLIGFFVNTLVLRTRFEANPSFEKLLLQVRETTLQAYEHQDVPFEQVVEALQPQRSLSHSPLFQVMFVLQNAPIGEIELPGVTLTQLNRESTFAKFDLTLSISETNHGLVGSWQYNTDLFNESTIERMAGHFQNLLSAIVENPQQVVGEIPLLSEAERHQLLVEWNETKSEYPTDKYIHQLFEEQVERTPLSVAVVFEHQQLTYLELNQRANQLAHHLQSLGVGPEVLVGICVERSVEMVVGLLGILKAGGAYVPLDPNYPTERLSYMLADSGVKVLLTQQQLLSSLPLHTAQVVFLDTDWGLIEQYSHQNLDAEIGADNLVYVIYTSGSTGQPKGVLVAHQGLLNLVFWHQAAFGITPSDIATQLAGTAFDASAWELWPYLSIGASIHLLKIETIVQPQVLQNWLISQKITITFIPTPLLESLLLLEWPPSIALRIVLTGGDKLHQYSSTSLPFRVINNYGPTENTVVTTSGLIVSTEQTNLLPPIGRPISNTQIYILDQRLQPVPIGVTGEMYIGGDGLANIVPQVEVSATTEDLRHFLKQKLPNYMIPSVFVLLSTLPLTPNGKVDRSALLVPDQPNSEGKLFVAPQTLTEEMLARIWAEILNIESFTRGQSNINIYDNFFDLGGHSLVATLLITRIRQVFQVDLPLWRLFDAPTIAGLASSIETERQTNILKHQIEPKPWSSLVPIQLGGSKRPFFLVSGGNGSEFNLINYAKLVYFLGQDQPVYGLKTRGCDPKQQPHTQVEVMASDYIKEIRTLQPSGPYLLGGECIGGVVAFEMARQLVAVGQKVGLLILIDTQYPSHVHQIRYFLKRVTVKIQKLKRIPYHLTKLLQLNSRELQLYTFDKVQTAKEVFVEQNYATVLMRYKPRPYIGRMTLLVNEDYYQKNPAIGWDHVAAGGLEIHQVPGDHDSYLGKYVKTTSDVLKGCLDAAQREFEG